MRRQCSTAELSGCPNLISPARNDVTGGRRSSSQAHSKKINQLLTIQISRYVYEGRGWKLLLVLNTILSNTVSDLPFLRDEEGKEFVDLLISLYQVSTGHSL